MGPPLPELDEQLVVEQSPPDRDGLARQVGDDVVESAIDPDAGVTRYAAVLGFARKGAEAFPGTHLPQALTGKHQKVWESCGFVRPLAPATALLPARHDILQVSLRWEDIHLCVV